MLLQCAPPCDPARQGADNLFVPLIQGLAQLTPRYVPPPVTGKVLLQAVEEPTAR